MAHRKAALPPEAPTGVPSSKALGSVPLLGRLLGPSDVALNCTVRPPPPAVSGHIFMKNQDILGRIIYACVCKTYWNCWLPVKLFKKHPLVTKPASEDLFFLKVAVTNLAVTFEACYVAGRYPPQGHTRRGSGWQEAVGPNKTASHSCKADCWEARYQQHQD